MAEIETKNLKIGYLLPSAVISGGAAVVLQHLNRLKKRGYENVSIIVADGETKMDWFKDNAVPVVSGAVGWENIAKSYDILVATHWSTAHKVFGSKAKRKMYFVQSDERRFILDEKNLAKVQETYQLAMEYMTEAKWIQRWLKEEFNHDAYYVPNGLDESIFFKTEPIEKKTNKPRVLIEGPLNSHLKGMEEAYAAIKDIDCEKWLISSSGKLPEGWKIDRFFNAVPIDEMCNIYSACDVFLKMSRVEGFFGPPMEAMACGCSVVVGKCSGYDEYIVDRTNALVVEKSDAVGAKKAVELLISDTTLRDKLIKNGYQTVKEWNWERSIDLLEEALRKEPVKKYYADASPERYNYVVEMGDLRHQLVTIKRATQYYVDEIDKLTKNFFFKPFWFGLRATRKIIRVWKSIFAVKKK